jgi:tRNA-methyltransferase O
VVPGDGVGPALHTDDVAGLGAANDELLQMLTGEVQLVAGLEQSAAHQLADLRQMHRSADRPNPIGLHEVKVAAVEGLRIRVRHLEALDGTPIVDVKPVLRRP